MHMILIFDYHEIPPDMSGLYMGCTLQCHQTWLAGTWTIEKGCCFTFFFNPPFNSGIFQPATFDETRGQKLPAFPSSLT